MRRKLYILLVFTAIVLVGSFFLSVTFGVVLFVLVCFAVLAMFVFLLMNKIIKKTNWWYNQYKATEQFITGVGYRDNIIRNYDIVNLGSNPARYAFFYEDVKGQSWATGSQGQDMDFEILKFYHSYLKENGVVLIPIMPFSALSPYLKEHPEHWGLAYYSKFAKILDYSQILTLPNGRRTLFYLRFPLLFNWRAVRYIFRDVKEDNTYWTTEQPMMKMELEQDATIWINAWLKEFGLNGLDDVFDERWKKYIEEAVSLNRKMVDFCLDRNLKPVFICVPMTKHLSCMFTEKVFDYLVLNFVGECNVHHIPFLDYTHDDRFINDNLYLNSFFLNLKGRKTFTTQVLKDLNLL